MGAAQLSCGDTGAARLLPWSRAVETRVLHGLPWSHRAERSEVRAANTLHSEAAKGGEAPVRERKSAYLNGAAVINTTKREADTVGEIAQDGAFVE